MALGVKVSIIIPANASVHIMHNQSEVSVVSLQDEGFSSEARLVFSSTEEALRVLGVAIVKLKQRRVFEQGAGLGTGRTPTYPTLQNIPPSSNRTKG